MAASLLCALIPSASGGAEPALIDRVVAVVNGEIITLSETRQTAWGMQRQGTVLAGADARQLAAALDRLIDQRLLAQAAREMKIRPDPEAVDGAVAGVMKSFHDRFGGDAPFLEFLRQSGFSAETFQSVVRRHETGEHVIRVALARRARVTPKEVKAFEDERRGAGEETVYYLIDQILIALPADAGRDEEEKARRRATEVFSREQNGEDFSKLAGEVSDDVATAANGGGLGWVARRHLKPELLEAVEKLRDGEVLPPVRTSLGFHVVRLRGTRDARAMLLARKMEEERSRWIVDLRAKARLEFFPYEKKDQARGSVEKDSPLALSTPKLKK